MSKQNADCRLTNFVARVARMDDDLFYILLTEDGKDTLSSVNGFATAAEAWSALDEWLVAVKGHITSEGMIQ